MSRQEIEDFLSRLHEIQENRKRTKWRPEAPSEQREFVFAIWKVEFNHYEENSIADEKLLLQGPARPIVIMPEKPQRHLTGGRYIRRCMDGGTCEIQTNIGKTLKPTMNHRASPRTHPRETQQNKD